MRLESILFSRLPDTAPGAPLPTEFRIFSAGENPSTKGSVLFDDRAAELVMACANAWGNEYILDLEHYSLKPRLVDPLSTDADARGYFRPEMRGGELWATGVSWTPDGEMRLRERRQRYMSPAFYAQETDEATGLPRVTELINAGLVAQPATYQLQPLVASTSPLDTYARPAYAPASMPDTVSSPPVVATPTQAELDALAAQAKAEADAAEVARLAAEADKAMQVEASRVEAQVLAASKETSLSRALVVLNRQLLALSGASDLPSAVACIAYAVTHSRAVKAAELRSLVIDLVALGAETPATAWVNDAPAARLASEGTESLRSRVAALRASKPAAVRPPVGAGGDGEDALEDFERRDAAKIKDPETRARFVASRLARKNKA